MRSQPRFCLKLPWAEEVVPVVEALPEELESLSKDIHDAWKHCRAAIASGDKELIRNLHIRAKQGDLSVNYRELQLQLERRKSFFPAADKIDPVRIDPVLVPVRTRSIEEHLFKVVRGYWSMPYSKGYGRRLRFIVMDRYHEAVIGIIGLQSPSADLACRDDYLGVPKERKLSVINNTLEAYTIGASPTYAPLLAGKLVAGMLHSDVIRKEYWRTYGNRRTTQLGKKVPHLLLAITTSSAFGRSSIYNRLTFNKRRLATSLGYTKGFGTIHLEEHYPRMVKLLTDTGRYVPAGFGNGPKVRWQNVIRTLADLGMPRNYLEHGLRREVFIFELVGNLLDVCRDNATPEVRHFDDNVWADYWKERWCLPRVARKPEWNCFDPYASLMAALKTGGEITSGNSSF